MSHTGETVVFVYLIQEERSEVLSKLRKREEEKKQLLAELERYKECDPEVLEEMKQETKVAKEAANRWTGEFRRMDKHIPLYSSQVTLLW